jgi:hypothetical protein
VPCVEYNPGGPSIGSVVGAEGDRETNSGVQQTDYDSMHLIVSDMTYGSEIGKIDNFAGCIFRSGLEHLRHSHRNLGEPILPK